MIGTQRVRARWGQPMACSGAMRRLVCCLALFAACEKSTPATESSTPPAADVADPLAGKPVVRNVEAKTGDVTVCPYSGRKFVVKDDSPRWEYEGKTYVFCAQKALDAVQQDPAKYLADFDG